MMPAHISTSVKNRGAVLAIILISYLMIVLDISIVITGLPKIQQSLDFSATSLSWVQNAYTLSFGGFLLLGARAGDILGRRRMFIIGLGIFTAASLAIGAAQTSTWMIAARAIQGLGSAILAPSTLALLTTNFSEGPDRSRAVSYYAAIAGVGASIGLVLGGVLADWVSWRCGFFINLPIGVALIVAARQFLAETELRPGQFDLVGATTSTFGMVGLVYGIVRAADVGWTDTITLSVLIVSSILLIVFVINELYARQPIMPLRLFARRERTAAYTARMLFLGAMVGFWFFTTQFLQGVLNYSPAIAGASFLPTTIPNFIAAMAVAQLTKRYGSGILLVVSLVISAIGMFWLSQATAGTAYLTGIALPMVLIGAGQGGALGPLTNSAMVGIAPDDAGAASGLVNVAHQLGGSLGLGILVTIFASSNPANSDAHQHLAHRLAAAFFGGTVMLTLALLIVLILIAWPALSVSRRTVHTQAELPVK